MEKCSYFGNERVTRFPGILIYDEEVYIIHSGNFRSQVICKIAGNFSIINHIAGSKGHDKYLVYEHLASVNKFTSVNNYKFLGRGNI